ncbi:MAG: hypothetical protein ACTSUC_09785 [Promethearchaeota archaeon]
MEKKEVKIGNKTFIVRELLAVESDEIMDLELDKITKKIKERLKRQAEITEEEYSKLTEKERDNLLKAMNEVNGWDFQMPNQDQEKEKELT